MPPFVVVIPARAGLPSCIYGQRFVVRFFSEHFCPLDRSVCVHPRIKPFQVIPADAAVHLLERCQELCLRYRSRNIICGSAHVLPKLGRVQALGASFIQEASH